MSTNAKYLEQLLLLSLNLPMAAIINQSVLILFLVELDPVLQKSKASLCAATVYPLVLGEETRSIFYCFQDESFTCICFPACI